MANICRFFRTAPQTILVIVAWAAGFCSIQAAAETPGASAPPGFRTILEKQERATFQSIADYLTTHPEAEDAPQAARWLLKTARTNGFEADAIPIAELLLKKTLNPEDRSAAQQVLCLGWAKTGKIPEALGLFDSLLKGVRFQAGAATLDFAQTLAMQARVANDFAASREIYERTAAAFPLSPGIGELAEGKIARHELVGKPAPRIGANDLDGKRVDWDEFAGKVVLVDFWATNCPPCLAEFPLLREVYAEFHDKGFEILGISFDDSPQTVEFFAKEAPLPWRMVMNDSPEGQISKRFNASTIPALYFVDRKGQVVQFDVRGPELRTVVRKLVEAKAD